MRCAACLFPNCVISRLVSSCQLTRSVGQARTALGAGAQLTVSPWKGGARDLVPI